MKFGTTSVMLLSAAVLGMAVVAEVRYGAMDALALAFGNPGDEVGVPTPSAGNRPLLGRARELPALASMDATRERPLFFQNRRYPKPVEAKAPLIPKSSQPTKEVPLEALGSIKLSAIVIVNDERVALIREGGGAKTRQVRVGEMVKNWKLVEIRTDSVLFAGGGKREAIKLWTFEPGIASVPGARTKRGRRAPPKRNPETGARSRTQPRTGAGGDRPGTARRSNSAKARAVERANERARNAATTSPQNATAKAPPGRDCGLSRC